MWSMGVKCTYSDFSKGSATKRNLPQDLWMLGFIEIYKIYGDLQIG